MTGPCGPVLGSRPANPGLKPGLNLGNSSAAVAAQRMDLIRRVDGTDETVELSEGGRCIYDECPEYAYNMNPHVAAFGDESDRACDERCDVTTLM
ncbi:hypothetical protein F5883DRAFT_554176 [Diaporthe sp. PMI_573]|nr:hypothetical protein F5883DRAFT_554176 [Diaporthaceae sp. PMI_573]